VHVPPSIAIEVITPTPRDERRDRIEKASEYAAFGIKWYWLVDPALQSVEVWELGADGRYAQTVAAVAGVIDPVPGCDGLALDVDALWRELDALPQS
jgi:Uma2 family endonuclease